MKGSFELPGMRWVRASGTWDVLQRTASKVALDHLSLLSAGVAFFLLLGLFPGLAGLIAIYGFLADAESVASYFGGLSTLLPAEAAEVIQQQAVDLARAGAGLGWGAFFGMLFALWAGSKAMRCVVAALNIAYSQDETRGFFYKQFVYLTLTLAVWVAGLFSLLLIALIPVVVNFLAIPAWLRAGLLWSRWPVLLVIGMTVIAAIYRYGPAGVRPKWRFLSWGAGVATLLWLIASALFSLYVSNFANFDKTYGSLGAMVVLLMWLYITAFLLLIGAELDAQIALRGKPESLAGGV